LGAGLYFLAVWVAPDHCLDLGGSFDYVMWRCSHAEDYPYIDVPVYHLVSFWVFGASVIIALAAFVWLRPRGNAA
jgi:hypothetical protein